MAKLYGWGASVVILGALFKINHYEGADIMLIVGLGTESLIFFFSAFEPPHVEPDWSLVYPELAGMYHGKRFDSLKPKKKPMQELDDMLTEAKIEQDLIQRLGEGMKKLSESTSKLSDITDASSATSEYVKNVQNASKSVEELSSTYSKTSETLNRDLKETDKHFDNLKSASDNAASLSDTYKEASETMKTNLSAAGEFATSVNDASNSANILSKTYSTTAEKIQASTDKLEFAGSESKEFNEQLKKVSENLAALNTIYELQLQGSNENVESNNKLQSTLNQFLESLNESVEKTGQYQKNLTAINNVYSKQLGESEKQVKTTADLQETLDLFLENLNSSIETTSKYQEEVNSLTKNVAALNKVYGNMLSAMNINLGG
jgi:gliding motility-associated protein GldL